MPQAQDNLLPRRISGVMAEETLVFSKISRAFSVAYLLPTTSALHSCEPREYKEKSRRFKGENESIWIFSMEKH